MLIYNRKDKNKYSGNSYVIEKKENITKNNIMITNFNENNILNNINNQSSYYNSYKTYKKIQANKK